MMNLPIWKYRYGFFFGLFLVWMTFFDRNSFLYRFQLSGEISDLEESISEHQQRIVDLRQQKKDLFGNEKNLEKFAREHYLMKKDDEEIFVIVDPE
jgi:cell division protein DivIC